MKKTKSEIALEEATKEMQDSLSELEREKNISKNTMIDAVKTALFNAYKSNFKQENCEVEINPESMETNVYSVRTVVNEVTNDILEISLEDAKLIDENAAIDSIVKVKVDPKSFGRISVSNAKNQISQKLREEEKQVVFKQFAMHKGSCISGKVSRIMNKSISINLGDADGILTTSEQVPSEHFKVGDRIKVYVLDVTMTHKGPKIMVSRTHKELVRGLFEDQVTEMVDNTVEIKSISREPGSRSKIAVWSNDPQVDPVGSCVGMNGDRVDSVVDELFGEKIDIVNYDENPAYYIENALSPAKVIFVMADPDEKTASVVVPDYQLSLAIGKEGQNARLAARLTGYKIDIKSESQAREAGEFPDEYDENYDEEYYDDEYDELEDSELEDSELEDSEASVDSSEEESSVEEEE